MFRLLKLYEKKTFVASYLEINSIMKISFIILLYVKNKDK
jgi:hypothetical protein